MLKALESLSGVATTTINASKDDMVASLQALAPILRNLADAGQNLPRSLQVLLTYPFTDEVLNGAIKGDYLNVYLSVTAVPGTTLIPLLDPNTIAAGSANANLRRSAPLPLPAVGRVTTTPTPGPGPTTPGSTTPGPITPGITTPGTTPGSAPPAFTEPGSAPSGSATPGTPSSTPGGSPSSNAGGH
jgi:phospholipid/cholesterol/gamma-HCH transport system substrate-binding protein